MIKLAARAGIVGPILFVVGVVATVAFAIAIAVPLLPLLALAALIWILVRPGRPAIAA